MPSPATQALFDEAKKLGIGFYLGYGEIDNSAGAKRRFNTAILVDKSGAIIHKYRKIHLPGRAEVDRVVRRRADGLARPHELLPVACRKHRRATPQA